jgi:hypothetical protein
VADAAAAAAALGQARAHARLRDPLVEMDGPFESWSTLAEAIADLERARAETARRASR